MTVTENMENIYLAIVLAPLAGAILAGVCGGIIGRSGAHWATIIGVGISTILSMPAWKHIVINGGEHYNAAVYTWRASGDLRLEAGFLIDRLSVTMVVGGGFVAGMVLI